MSQSALPTPALWPMSFLSEAEVLVKPLTKLGENVELF
jgi:hypothetical protein